MENYSYRFDELIHELGYQIYSATRPKDEEGRFKYAVVDKGCPNLVRLEFDTRKEAQDALRKIAPIKEKGEDGKYHYYREYTLHRGLTSTLERTEYHIIKLEKWYRPKYSKKVLNTLCKCLTKIKEASVCARNVTRLVNGDCGEETFVEDLKEDMNNIRKEPVIDENIFKSEEEENYGQ